MHLSPGIVYLGSNFHHLLIPPTFVYVVYRVCQEYFNSHIPKWLVILASVMAFPVAFTFKVLYKIHVDERQATALGAVMPPRLPDPYPGGLQTLARVIHQVETGYLGRYILFYPFFITQCGLGDIMAMACEKQGNTINMRVLFEDRVYPCSLHSHISYTHIMARS